MNITITGRRQPIDETIREYIHERIQRVLRVSERLSSAQVVLEKRHGMHRVEALVTAPRGSRFLAHVEGTDLRGVIDAAEQKVEAQVRTWKDRLVQHRPKDSLRNNFTFRCPS